MVSNFLVFLSRSCNYDFSPVQDGSRISQERNSPHVDSFDKVTPLSFASKIFRTLLLYSLATVSFISSCLILSASKNYAQILVTIFFLFFF